VQGAGLKEVRGDKLARPGRAREIRREKESWVFQKVRPERINMTTNSENEPNALLFFK
jgi:hypothetical protein